MLLVNLLTAMQQHLQVDVIHDLLGLLVQRLMQLVKCVKYDPLSIQVKKGVTRSHETAVCE